MWLMLTNSMTHPRRFEVYFMILRIKVQRMQQDEVGH